MEGNSENSKVSELVEGNVRVVFEIPVGQEAIDHFGGLGWINSLETEDFEFGSQGSDERTGGTTGDKEERKTE